MLPSPLMHRRGARITAGEWHTTGDQIGDSRRRRGAPSEEASGARRRASAQEVGAAAGGIWGWLKKMWRWEGAPSEEASGTGGALRHEEGAAPGQELGSERHRE